MTFEPVVARLRVADQQDRYAPERRGNSEAFEGERQHAGCEEAEGDGDHERSCPC
jgi:hypothetical protein